MFVTPQLKLYLHTLSIKICSTFQKLLLFMLNVINVIYIYFKINNIVKGQMEKFLLHRLITTKSKR